MEDLKELSEKLDEIREDFEDLRDAWIEQTRAENIAPAEMLHPLWGISGQGVGACTVLSELGRDINPGAQTNVNPNARILKLHKALTQGGSRDVPGYARAGLLFRG